jgi:rubrerythrin
MTGYLLRLVCAFCGHRWGGNPGECCPSCGSDDVEPYQEAA